ncbi:hypothetical protein ACWIGW_38765 [Nocardia brasiliensis]
MVVNIRLTRRREMTAREKAQDALERGWYGYDPTVSPDELWQHNRGRWKLSERRLEMERFVTFSFEGAVIAVAALDGHEWVPDRRPGGLRIAFIGRPFEPGTAIYEALVGMAVPREGQNPVQYLEVPGIDALSTLSSPSEVSPDAGRALLLTWNPANWDWGGYPAAIEQTLTGITVHSQWSTGPRNSGVRPGDRAYLLRQGREGRGIFAAGTVVSEIEPDLHWDGSKRFANYVQLEWDTVLASEQCLTTDMLQTKLPSQHWSPQGSGVLVRTEVVAPLEALWAEHLAEVGRPEHAGDQGPGQRRQPDPARRKKVEQAAQHRLMDYYESLGWSVVDTHTANSFDALARRGAAVLYLEAKGTESAGASVLVTRGEVEHALAHPGRCMMGIWSGMEFGDDGEIDPNSGSFRVIPFEPDRGCLTVVGYEWRPITT